MGVGSWARSKHPRPRLSHNKHQVFSVSVGGHCVPAGEKQPCSKFSETDPAARGRGGSAHRDRVVLDHVHLRVVGVDFRSGRQLYSLEGRLEHRAKNMCHPSRGSGMSSAQLRFINFPVERNRSEGQREDARHSVSGTSDRGQAAWRVPRDFHVWVAGLHST